MEAAQAHRPELVLLDVGLPGVDGYEVARRLRDRWDGSLTIVALTDCGGDDDRHRTRAAGAEHHLVKPVDPDELRPVIGKGGHGS